MKINELMLTGKSDDELKRSGTLEDYFLNPEGGGGVSFEKSPRKRGRGDVRAVEAIADWEIGFEANRQLIVVSGTRYPHRGVLQLALGEEARMDRRGFEFDRSQMRWVITMRNFLRAFEGRTADISELGCAHREHSMCTPCTLCTLCTPCAHRPSDSLRPKLRF